MQTFTTPTPISATIDAPAGRIRFVAGDRADTTVEIRPVDASKGRDVAAAERTTVEFHDGTLRVATPVTREAFGPSGTIEVTVELPAGSHVGAKGSAEFHGAGPLGDVTVEGSYGPVDLAEAARVRIDTAAGDVSIGRLAGPADVTTTKGDIRITEAVRGAVVLHTQMGDITVGAAAGVSASLDAGTSSGRISNALRSDGTTELDISATTTLGDVTARSL